MNRSISHHRYLQTSPNDFIDLHSGIYPMELALLKACHRAMVRYLTLPDTHPLFQVICEAKRSPPRKHLSPINNHLKLFALRRLKLETIQLVAYLPRQIKWFETKIALNREESIHFEKQDNADFKVFSDSSGHDGGIGAAAILYKRNSAQPLKSLQLYLGPSSKHNNYKAEAVGALLALWFIRTTLDTIRKRTSLYINNQSIITAINSPRATSGQ